MNEQDRSAMIKATFDTVAAGYDTRTLRFFQESAEEMCSCLGLKGHEHVLDVATGTGNVAIQLAQHVPDGHVTGIDFSGGMLAQAKKKAQRQNLHNVSFREMDMQSIGFPNDTFDAAVCSFGIFFVENMEEQLQHISEKTKPGGKVAISCFYEDAFSPLADMFGSRIENYGVSAPPLPWKRIGTEEKCAALCQGSGLTDVRVDKKDVGYYLRDAEEWWNVIWWGGFRRYVEQLSPSDLERFRTEHLKDVGTLCTQAGIWLNLKVLLAVGARPSVEAS